MASMWGMSLSRLAVCSLALLVAYTLPAAADDAAVIEACLKSAYADNGKPQDCIGRVADACLDKPENQSTHAMSGCRACLIDQVVRVSFAAAVPQ